MLFKGTQLFGSSGHGLRSGWARAGVRTREKLAHPLRSKKQGQIHHKLTK
jgi:hypothetical protein